MCDRKALSVLSGSLTKVPLLIVDHPVASGTRGGSAMHTLTGFRTLLFFILDPEQGARPSRGAARASRRGLIASVRNEEGFQLGGLRGTGRGKWLAAGHAVVQRVLTARQHAARYHPVL